MNAVIDTRMEVLPSGAALGAEVRGVDIGRGLSEAELTAVRDAWATHSVLVFRDQSITDDQLIAFSECFGELDPPGPNPYGGGPIYPAYPQLNVISNIMEGGRPVGNLGAGEAVWHADMTYQDQPPKGAILYAVELPATGGNTQFASMRKAYATLPEHLKAAAEGRRAIHDAAHNSAGILRRGYEEVTDVRETPGARQPLVRTDPQTGERSLFLGRRPGSYVVGMEVDDSEALLDELWAHATRDEFVFTHEWRLGDLLMWDNLSVLHRRDEFDSTDRRRLHRAQLRGDGLIA